MLAPGRRLAQIGFTAFPAIVATSVVNALILAALALKSALEVVFASEPPEIIIGSPEAPKLLASESIAIGDEAADRPAKLESGKAALPAEDTSRSEATSTDRDSLDGARGHDTPVGSSTNAQRLFAGGNPITGVLAFVSARDFEKPADAGAENIYDVQVQVSDGIRTDTQAIAVIVGDVNDNAPAITSSGGGASAAVAVAENATAITTVTAIDADAGATLTYAIVGGADATLFTIDPITGVLAFVSARDFENPADAGADNVYDVQVRVSDGISTNTQAIAVTIGDVNDGVSLPPVFTGSLLANGSFENPAVAPATWTVTNIPEWTNTGGVGIEVWQSGFLSADATDGTFLIETDSFSDVNDVLSTTADAETGVTYAVTFDFAARIDGPHRDTDRFEIWWNGSPIGAFDPTSTVWQTASIQVVGADGIDTLQIREAGLNDSWGALIDNVNVVKTGNEWMV